MNLTKSLILATTFVSLSTIGSAATVTPTATAFDVSGVFADNSKLSGWFDISNGTVSSAAMTVSTVKGTFTLDRNDGSTLAAPGVWALNFNDDGATLTLDLVLAKGATNLTNYDGGELCNTSGNCGRIISAYLPANPSNSDDSGHFGCDIAVSKSDPQLTAGSVAPEPGSTVLLSAGLSALGLIFRKRFAKK